MFPTSGISIILAVCLFYYFYLTISLTFATIPCVYHGESPIIILGEKECKERGPEFDFELIHTNNKEYVFLALKVI